MEIKMFDASPVSEEEISKFENNLGRRLPEIFRAFIEVNNGAELASNFYDENCDCKYFIPLENIIKEKQYIDGLEDNKIPIAVSAGGCYILLSLSDETILYWDYSFPDKYQKVGTDIHDFLGHLKPEEKLVVEIHPDSKVIYTNAEFDEEQRRLGNYVDPEA